MPRYFFDIKNGQRLVDPIGLDCADDPDAVAKARLIAEAIRDARKGQGRHVAVIDDSGGEIAQVPIDLKQTTE